MIKKKIKKEKQNKKKNYSDNEEKDQNTDTYNTFEIIVEKSKINWINDVTDKEIKDNLDNIVFDDFFVEI